MHTTTRSAIPNPEAAFSPEKLINDLADPNMTLGDVAYLHDLTLEKLTLWILRPDNTERHKALTDSIYLRVRLAAINHLATTVNALNTMIGAYIDEGAHQHPSTPRTSKTANNAAAQEKRAPQSSRPPRPTSRAPFPPNASSEKDFPGRNGQVSEDVAPISVAAPGPTCSNASPTRNPITPRDLHHRAGQAPATTLSLFSLYPFGKDLGLDRAGDLCVHLPLNTPTVEQSSDVRTSPERLSDGERHMMSEAVERSDRLSSRLRSPLTQSFGARLNVQGGYRATRDFGHSTPALP